MALRKIKGMTKDIFLKECISIANRLNPTWEQDYFHVDNFVPTSIWNAVSNTRGFALSFIGGQFFEKALQLTPYYIKTDLLYSKDLINLNKRMPWPYIAGKYEGTLNTRIGIYSSEVAVWAALYNNDLERLLEAYSRT